MLDRGNTAVSPDWDYGCDAAGNVTSCEYPDGTLVNYSYDGNGRLDEMTGTPNITAAVRQPLSIQFMITAAFRNGLLGRS